jgi:hypothetical protein
MTAPDTMIQSTRAVIEQAVVSLAQVCDGAHEEDGRGFNKWDSDWGHTAATEIQAGGHVDPVRALKVVSKYRKQLERRGITLPDLSTVVAEVEAARPAPPAPGSFESAVAAGGLAIKLIPQWFGAVGPQLAIHGSYPAHVETVRQLPKRRWAAEMEGKPWLVPASFLQHVVAALPGAHLSPEVRELVQQQSVEMEAREKAEREAAAERAVSIDSAIARYEALVPTLAQPLFAHQDSGVRWLIETQSAILADDMGLGKSRVSLIAARALNHRIIVVAPAGLRINWLREAEAVHARIEIYSWAKVPETIRGDYTLIADEAHYAQNMKAQRTKRFLALAKAAKAVFALTGTPIKNGRPTNLFPLLVATNHPLGKDRSHFERRYCNAGPTSWTKWDVTGAAHLEELHELIRDGLLRRMKEECLDLPGKLRVVRDIRDELSTTRAIATPAPSTTCSSITSAASWPGEIEEADALVMLNHLRHASSLAKVEAAIEMAEEVIEQGGQVVIFTRSSTQRTSWWRSWAGAVASPARTTRSRVRPRSTRSRRATEGDRLHAGRRQRRHHAHAAQTVILVDRPWTPGDALQAEDRLYRIGRSRACWRSGWKRPSRTSAWTRCSRTSTRAASRDHRREA